MCFRLFFCCCRRHRRSASSVPPPPTPPTTAPDDGRQLIGPETPLLSARLIASRRVASLANPTVAAVTIATADEAAVGTVDWTPLPHFHIQHALGAMAFTEREYAQDCEEQEKRAALCGVWQVPPSVGRYFYDHRGGRRSVAALQQWFTTEVARVRGLVARFGDGQGRCPALHARLAALGYYQNNGFDAVWRMYETAGSTHPDAILAYLGDTEHYSGKITALPSASSSSSSSSSASPSLSVPLPSLKPEPRVSASRLLLSDAPGSMKKYDIAAQYSRASLRNFASLWAPMSPSLSHADPTAPGNAGDVGELTSFLPVGARLFEGQGGGFSVVAGMAERDLRRVVDDLRVGERLTRLRPTSTSWSAEVALGFARGLLVVYTIVADQAATAVSSSSSSSCSSCSSSAPSPPLSPSGVRAVPMEVYGLGVLNRELEVLLQPGLALTVTRIDRDQAFCAREFTRYAHSRQTDVCVTVVHCDVRAL